MTTLSGRSVLVTGAGGFIGGHLAARLVEEGASVRGFLRYTSRGYRGALEWFEPEIVDEISIEFGDLRDVESVARAVDGCEIVFHLAAQISVPHSFVSPRDFFETNVLGSLNVAQAARSAEVERLIHTSTSEVYGTAQTVPITEDHPLGVQSPYAASKVAADKLMEAFYRTYELPVCVLRPFNTYGPHQSQRAVIPTIISQAVAGTTLRLGSVAPIRDLTYVSDTVAGFLAVSTNKEVIGRTIQLGTGAEVAVEEIVDIVGDLLGKQLTVEQDEDRIRPAQSEVERLVSDPGLVKRLTGWEPKVDMREGLQRTIEWIESHPELFDTKRYAV
jgi:NAD dependent epimerase/dehydratase